MSKKGLKVVQLALLTSALEGKETQEFMYPNNDLAHRVRSIIQSPIIVTVCC